MKTIGLQGERDMEMIHAVVCHHQPHQHDDHRLPGHTDKIFCNLKHQAVLKIIFALFHPLAVKGPTCLQSHHGFLALPGFVILAN